MPKQTSRLISGDIPTPGTLSRTTQDVNTSSTHSAIKNTVFLSAADAISEMHSISLQMVALLDCFTQDDVFTDLDPERQKSLLYLMFDLAWKMKEESVKGVNATIQGITPLDPALLGAVANQPTGAVQ